VALGRGTIRSFGDDCQGALGADHHLGQVEFAVAHERIQIVAADTPLDRRVALLDRLPVGFDNALDLTIDLIFPRSAVELRLHLGFIQRFEHRDTGIGEDNR
jgi:hypothetical protein